MQNWDADKYLNSVSIPNISLKEERELFSIIKGEDYTQAQKDSAIEKIVRSHIRFVSQMANYYCKKCQVDMDDMIGAGVIGMMTAIEKFELEKNCKFTTYCGYWIKLEMIRHIQESCPVAIPQSIHDGLIKIQTAIRESDGEMDREEIKEKLEFSEEKMQKLERAKSVNTVSLQKRQGSGDDSSMLEDLIPDDNSTPYDDVEKEDLLSYLREILYELDPRIREIVLSKYEEDKVRLQDLADKYNVSAERIRQIRVQETKKIQKKLFRKNLQEDEILP